MNLKLKMILLAFVMFFVLSCNSSKKEKPLKEKTDAILIKKVLKNKEKSPNNLSTAYGIDISKYQGIEINQLNKEKDSISFIICKATEGVTYTDPKFLYNWKNIKEKGFVRGVYHFYRSNDNPILQADNFLKAIKNIKKSDIPPVIDFEEGGIDKKESIKDIQEVLKTFITRIETKLGCKPILYTDINTSNVYLKDAFFAGYPLWIANYNNKKKPDLPFAWKEKGWLIWQKSASYKLAGNTNDLDEFNGSLLDLKEFIKNSW